MNRVITLYNSSIGKKYIMALTGIIGVGFVFMHMAGNLQVFAGPEHLDSYARFLRSTGSLLWVARGTLLGAVALHVLAAYQLTQMSHTSRPVQYVRWKATESTYASRTMRWSGPILLLFIIYHLLHFTFGKGGTPFEEGHVYNNVIAGFQNPLVSGFYIVAMLSLGLHMYHGVWSMFQSLGANHPRYNYLLRQLAAVITAIVVVGNISIPVAVLLRLVK